MRAFLMAKIVLGNLLSGPATLMYPKKKRAFTPITRGRVENDIQKCILCGLCARRCPTYALGVTKVQKLWEIDRLKCCTCNLCVEICPVQSLSMLSHYPPPVADRSAALHIERKNNSSSGSRAQR